VTDASSIFKIHFAFPSGRSCAAVQLVDINGSVAISFSRLRHHRRET
jgi:hypothetical protein